MLVLGIYLRNKEIQMIIKSMPITRLLNSKHSQLVEDFHFYSDVLKQWCMIPTGFITDYESIPIIRGTSKVSGLIHDYLVRSDALPTVDKKTAAKVYLEALTYRNTSYIRRYIKYYGVRMAQGYMHKHKVLATLEEIQK